MTLCPGAGESRWVRREFDVLQREMGAVWPLLTLRSIGSAPKTVIVVHSLSNNPPAHLAPTFQAYEERFLCMALGLLRSPGSRVVYVTSQPVLGRLVDYWLGLIPGMDTTETRRRLFFVSPVDGTPRPLSAKLLDRPLLLERIKRLVLDPRLAIIQPFVMSDHEARLALALNIPVYGSHPELTALGTKSVSRRLFSEEGVPHPAGVEDIRSRGDLRDAIRAIREERPRLSGVVVKLDGGFGGHGNGMIDLLGRDDDELEDAVLAVSPDDAKVSPEEFLALLESGGGIVEERIVGEEYQSPSVQLRAGPAGQVEVLSTHDQILGGPHGLSFRGSRFPADPSYALAITRLAETIGGRLAREGVIGRFAVDFVTVRDRGQPWRPYAIEINLRSGGTTHPYFALQALADAAYDPERTQLVADGVAKHYVASDFLQGPDYQRLTPDDLLDLVATHQLGWDAEHKHGIVFHLASALPVAGHVGATAIADSPAQAQAIYEHAQQVLDTASQYDGRKVD